mgnify:CR=1 FL=1
MFLCFCRKKMTDLRDIALQNLQMIIENKNDVFLQNESSKDDDNAFVMMLTMTALRKMVYIKSILKTLIKQLQKVIRLLLFQ